MKNHLKFVFILALFLCTGFSALAAQTRLKSQSPSCHEKRAVIDIGSSSTKLKVAIVDTCLQKLVHVLGESAEKVEFKKSLDQTKTREEPGYFTEEILQQGLAVLQAFKAESLSHGVKEENVIAIATAAMRSSANSKVFIQRAQEKLRLPITVVSQEEEGRLGYFSALAEIGDHLTTDEIVVWDIGGGSTQLTYYNRKSKKFEVCKNEFASQALKNAVLRQQNKVIENSPNPMSTDHISWAIEESKKRNAENSFTRFVSICE